MRSHQFSFHLKLEYCWSFMVAPSFYISIHHAQVYNGIDFHINQQAYIYTFHCMSDHGRRTLPSNTLPVRQDVFFLGDGLDLRTGFDPIRTSAMTQEKIINVVFFLKHIYFFSVTIIRRYIQYLPSGGCHLKENCLPTRGFPFLQHLKKLVTSFTSYFYTKCSLVRHKILLICTWIAWPVFEISMFSLISEPLSLNFFRPLLGWRSTWNYQNLFIGCQITQKTNFRLLPLILLVLERCKLDPKSKMGCGAICYRFCIM